MNTKKLAAEQAVEEITDGMTVGLGTGSTAYYAIEKLGERVKEGLQIRAVATSKRSEEQARELGIPIVPFAEVKRIDITVDGADEVDDNLELIKGGGGALLREKIVAARSDRMIVIVGENKMVSTLGQFPLPVEIVPFAHEWTLEALESLDLNPGLRMDGDQPYVTDNGNYIADCRAEAIPDPAALHAKLNDIPGVVENGLFVSMAHTVVVGREDGSVQTLRR
ncbi:ribose-5-phosphate isomerase RpiA [Saccharibacillus sp. CPCC 101409]|uniref:ribose-5-phosphate isomerase RpiA n=1 Tax=Saccharibacillus sp. CPCC 101409 TaxID=3058041 RepID=UPI0026729E0F|nr:ribose-5-phosphate isomerase RpiA [Saccharibacillus sp. CPCC 101409]MDO3410764.1 ribose-5-phosphate isomerase RpiA [Saccharibacillus sp. CPCC 101409]